MEQNKKLIMTTKTVGRPSEGVEIRDRIGNVEYFDSTKAAAEYMEVDIYTIYNAITRGTKVRGCVVKRF